MQFSRRHAPLLGLATLVALGLAAAHPAAAQSTYTFEDQPIVAPAGNTPFTDTQNGLAATFSTTPSDGYDYAQVDGDGDGVTAPKFNNMSGHILTVNAQKPGGAPGSLNIGFDHQLSSIFLDFGTQTTAIPLTLTAYLNGTSVGSETATGIGPDSPDGTYEGTLNFDGATFNSVTLTPLTQTEFAVDNVTATPTPEPSSVAAFAFTGLGALGLMLRARKRNAAA